MRFSKLHILPLLVLVIVVSVGINSANAEDLGGRSLYYGMRGTDVATLQQTLNDKGFNAGAVDGVFGPNTQRAVINFQRSNSLSVDGVVGPQTWAALSSGGKTYVVQHGDSLWQIATKQGTTVAALKQNNNLQTNSIYPGQVLKIASVPTAFPSNYSKNVDLLARVIHAEAKGETYTGKVAVGAVILNRIDSSQFPNTLSGVIYQPYQFETVHNGTIWQTPDASAYQAARDALNGWDPTHGATFFYNPSKVSHSWMAARPMTTRIGGHVFMR